MPPVPVYVKGGVWTNIEDQILKAAVSKYGTHQWSKIASLLRKKSARQCQIRWTEFLNPNLNNDRFSKEEDIRLLKLSQQFPNQWRTIGELMGRTAQLCNDRYNKLLSEPSPSDKPVKIEGNVPKLPKNESKFKVGDLNPQIDTQQALPDKEEFDDDEREMLAEARERLLSTQGKKATRKIRERMLEESKRIAQLQKRRELKQAGITTKIKKMKKKYSTEIDYNLEIPYEQTPLSGKYNTIEETERSRKELAKFEREFEKNASKNRLNNSDDDDVDARDKQRARKRQKRKQYDKEKPEHNATVERSVKKIKPRPKLVLSKPGIESYGPDDVTIDHSRFNILNEQNKEPILSSQGGAHDGTVIPKIEPSTENFTSENNVPIAEEETPITVDDEFTKLFKQRQLVHFFEMLPTPRNDFEIMLDENEEEEDIEEAEEEEEEEEEEKDTLHSKTNEIQTESEFIKVPLKLSCLKENNSTLPDMKSYPKDEFDEMFNTLVGTSINQTGYFVSRSQMESFNEIEKMVEDKKNANMKKAETYFKPGEYEAPSYSKMESKIKENKSQIKKLQKRFDYLAPLIQRNTELNHDIYQKALPRLKRLQDEYYVTYKVYMDELRQKQQR